MTSQISKLCKVLYAKPTFSKVPNSFVRQAAGIDLVLSCYDVNLLSPLLFSIEGIRMSGKMLSQPPDVVCPPIEDYFKLEPSNAGLDALRLVVTKQWARRERVARLQRYTEPAAVYAMPWVFNGRPAKSVVTSENNILALNSRNITKSQYDLKDHIGSRFFRQDESLKVDNNSLVRVEENPIIDPDNYLRLKAVLYESFDSMPAPLQNWLNNVILQDVEPQPEDQDRIDLLLHGFKGFN